MSNSTKQRIYLSIVSGKGGSGKTTFALSLAVLLSKCKKTVLLFDCDFVTNGATHFFKKTLNHQAQSVRTAEDYIYNAHADESIEPSSSRLSFHKVQKHFSFVPSIGRVSKEYSQKTGKLSFKGIEELAESRGAEIVIFDCQAGYSAVTKFLIEKSSIVLVVLEADAVSASAEWVLLEKMPGSFKNRTVFQVMNKVSEEEHKAFSHITTGTLFPNITPMMFNWYIKDCFAYSRFPQIDVTNFYFSIGICDIACTLFPEFKKEILEIRLELFYQRERSVKDMLSSYIAKGKVRKPTYWIWFTSCLLLVIVLFALIYITLTDAAKTSGVLLWGILGAVFLDIVLALTFRNAVPAETEEEALEHRENEDLLHKLDSQIVEMESELKTCANETDEDD